MNNDFEKVAMRVSYVSITVNIILSLLKLVAGIVAKSSAMVSDAIHSASDVFSTFVVIIGIRISSRESDKEHPYGHEKFECVAAVVLASVLAVTGLMIGSEAVEKIFKEGVDTLNIPGYMALVAAMVSIVVKEGMFWYTKINAKKIDSGALMADAWHHRSDALSSVGALIGIMGAILGYPICDLIASLIICLFIEKAAFDIFNDAIRKMVDESCTKETEDNIRQCASRQAGVIAVDMLRTRMFGNKIYVDIEISADGNMTLNESHEIAENVHDAIEKEFTKVKHVMVHVNPAKIKSNSTKG